MSPWMALLVPIIGAAIMLLFFSRKALWWELLIPIAASALVIFIFKLCVTAGMVSATEYRGSIIVSARYTEYYETYVHRTCSRTVSCGKNCTRTEFYDCSYCDDNAAHWDAYDQYGHEYRITEEKYNQLKGQWHSTPKFVDLHRNIDYSGSCGKDGDAYDIFWDGQPNTSDAAVWTKNYTNRVQTAKSRFNYEDISDKEAKRDGLFAYPEQFDYYRQHAILGLDSIKSGYELERIQRQFEFFDGYYGKRKHVKLFVLLFYDKPQSIAFKQEAYWVGGNDNELVVCISMNRQTHELQWTKAFSWCENKRVIVDCREDIMNSKYFNADSVYAAIANTVEQNFTPRDLDKPFSYMQVEIPTWAIVVTFILAILVTAGTSYWAVTNDLTYDDPTGQQQNKYRY